MVIYMMKIKKGTRVIIATLVIIPSFILNKIYGYNTLVTILMILTTIVAGLPVIKNAVNGIRYKVIGIDLLVTIAVIGAIFIKEYWEAAAVTYLFMLGDYLEAKTLDKTRSAISALVDMAPDIARVIRDGVEYELASDEVIKGDKVLVKPGEKIAVDGIVIEGNAYVNQAAITGESIPVEKEVGAEVFSGTIIESGYLLIDALRVGEDTTFARILEMVEEAQDKKARTQKFIEKFSKYYTPGVVLLAIIVFLISLDLHLALTLLVIACPGALVISTPVSIVAGIGNGAKAGILFKGGEVIEKLGKIKTMAFDKTGTLTIGKPVVNHVKAYGIDEKEVIKIAAIGEYYSEHPLAKAIINKANEYGEMNEIPENVEISIGKGLAFVYQNQKYYIGNRKLFLDTAIDEIIEDIEAEEAKGQTVVLFGYYDQILGIIAIADQIRDDAKGLIKRLRKLGVKKLIMLTGDNKLAANTIANELGLDEYHAELLPDGKVEIIKQLQQKYGAIAMVGDGVNDAPALATADLGIAVGGAGKDVAMETADIILMSEKISKLSYAVGLSRATVNNIAQNLGFALIVVSVLLTGVLFSLVNLSIGMLVHELSVLLVIINAVRLLGYGKSKIGEGYGKERAFAR